MTNELDIIWIISILIVVAIFAGYGCKKNNIMSEPVCYSVKCLDKECIRFTATLAPDIAEEIKKARCSR